ncbi:hypothetical protein FOQG_18355 [Fusarium oxysporum f. sp. raphani 54005]|uniref:EKC/KEOPS complex subunit BUD32 n=1 Tax=Fusarium oxysporum f. sp. raphani 54005 TaxID=1089458 RepID=X0BDL5_FUSOX|nr:hypothetical protein FOQG_18355 [Fusarium oxysporum f. sp. raphani 54005]
MDGALSVEELTRLLREAEQRAKEERQRAEEAERERQEERQRAEREQQRAEEAERERQEERQRAEREQQRAEREQQRAEEAERQQQEERQRAEASEEQTRLTTLDEYIAACHTSVFSRFAIETDPKLTSRGSITNPRDKWCPKNLRPWPDFLDQQKLTFGALYDAFPTESRVFENRNFLAGLGNRISQRPIADEKTLEYFLHNSVEDPNMGDMNRSLEDEAIRSLRAMHRKGVIHKDVRLENMLFNPETNGVMVIDFERALLLKQPRRPLAQLVPNKRAWKSETMDAKKVTGDSNKRSRSSQSFSEDIWLAKTAFLEWNADRWTRVARAPC